MKLKAFSNFMTRAMLVVLALLLTAAVVQGAMAGRAFTAAFAVGAVGFALLCLLMKRADFSKLRPVKTGAVICAFCFLINLIFVLAVRIEPTVDYLTFWLTACDIADGVEPAQSVYVSLFPHIFGYSAFLSVFLRVFGHGALVAPIVNVCLTTVTCVCIYSLCLENFGLRSAAAAALLWSLCPSKLFYNTMVLSEPYYTALFMLLLVVFSKAQKREGKSFLWAMVFGAAAAILLRLINTARPIAAVLIIALFLWLLLLRGEKLSDRRSAAWYAVMAAALIAVYIPSGKLWDNYVSETLGREISGFPGYSVSVGFNTETNGSYYDPDMQRLLELAGQEGVSADDAQKQLFETAKGRITSGEIDFPRFFAVKLARLMGDDEAGAFYLRDILSQTQFSLLAVISNVFYYMLVLLCLYGIVCIAKKPITGSLLIAPIYIIGLIMAQLLVEVACRYHYSAIPAMIILASAAFRRKTDEN